MKERNWNGNSTSVADGPPVEDAPVTIEAGPFAEDAPSAELFSAPIAAAGISSPSA
jgi:hypothetical protein